jgi:hypothetical protein
MNEYESCYRIKATLTDENNFLSNIATTPVRKALTTQSSDKKEV